MPTCFLAHGILKFEIPRVYILVAIDRLRAKYRRHVRQKPHDIFHILIGAFNIYCITKFLIGQKRTLHAHKKIQNVFQSSVTCFFL